jgi:hypothetical protein
MGRVTLGKPQDPSAAPPSLLGITLVCWAVALRQMNQRLVPTLSKLVLAALPSCVAWQ